MCDRGFVNDIIVNMFCRIHPQETLLVNYGKKFNELYFIQEGAVLMYSQASPKDFMMLTQYSYFGDY